MKIEDLTTAEYLFFLKALKEASNLTLFPCTFESPKFKVEKQNDRILEIKFNSSTEYSFGRQYIVTLPKARNHKYQYPQKI